MTSGPPSRTESALAGNMVAQAKVEFLLRMRAKGIRDLNVLRALETVPREMFVPHRYADLAAKDVMLPIPCGQTMQEPYFVARMMEALSLAPGHRVLEIGSGSGYATAILARLAIEVLSIERFQSLALEAMTRLESLGIMNARILWGDAFALSAEIGHFDRIAVHAVCDALPPPLLDTLAPDGVMVLARSDSGGGGQMLVRFSGDGAGRFNGEPVCPSRLRHLVPGISKGL